MKSLTELSLFAHVFVFDGCFSHIVDDETTLRSCCNVSFTNTSAFLSASLD